jgi:protein-tyrosine-phosphatase
MATRVFSICFICTGNRFRSPLTQAFLERLTLGLPVQISTAGTVESQNAPALPEARQIAVLCGVDLSEHRSQRLSALSLEATDLVIGFEEAHVRHAIVDAGAQRANAFTFREFVRLVRNFVPAPGLMTVERAGASVTFADGLRRRDPAAVGEHTGVPDPLGRSWKAQLEIAREIRELSLELAQHLFGVAGSKLLLPIPEKVRRRPRWAWRPLQNRSLRRGPSKAFEGVPEDVRDQRIEGTR